MIVMLGKTTCRVKAIVGQSRPAICGLDQHRAMDDFKTIGGRIRQVRVAKGLTQVDLAAAIGVSRAHLTNVEGGNGGLALDKLSILARETGTTVAWLIGEAMPADRERAELLAAYDAMNKEQRQALLAMAQVVARRDAAEEPAPARKRRATACVVPAARAGEGLLK
jgi:transcriptional regulator with XRE-family HTH domain